MDLTRLPDRLLQYIFYLLDSKDRISAELVCRRFYNLTPYDDIIKDLGFFSRTKVLQFFKFLDIKRAAKKIGFFKLIVVDPPEGILMRIQNVYAVSQLHLTFTGWNKEFNEAPNNGFIRIIQGGFTNVVDLRLKCCSFQAVTDQGFFEAIINKAVSSNLPNLTFLNITDCDWCPDLLPASLQTFEFRLHRPLLSERRLSAMLAPCLNLRSLLLHFHGHSTRVLSDYCLPFLPQLTKLSVMSGLGVEKADKLVVKNLLNSGGFTCPLLEEITFEYCSFTLEPIPTFKLLKELRIGHCCGSIDRFLNDTCPQDLSFLQLNRGSISDETIALIAERFIGLHFLSLCLREPEFTGNTLRKVFLRCRNLQRLGISFELVNWACFSIASAAYASSKTRIVLDFGCESLPYQRLLAELLNECEKLKQSNGTFERDTVQPTLVRFRHIGVEASEYVEQLICHLEQFSFNVVFHRR